MTALWGFAAYVTVQDGLNLLFVSTLDTNVGRPTESLVDALQQERRLSVVALSDPAVRSGDLAASRERTDRSLIQWRAATDQGGIAVTDELRQRIDQAAVALAQLDEVRAEIDDGTADRTAVTATITAMINTGFDIYGAVSLLDDQAIAEQSRTLISLTRARELLSQEDALLAGALSAGELTAADIAELTQLVGSQRFTYATAAAALPSEDAVLYQEAVSGPAVTALREREDQLMEARAGTAPFSAATWQETVAPALTALRDVELAAADNTLQRAAPAALGTVLRLLLAGGLGLLAVLAAIIVSVTTARSLIRQLERLRDAARELAQQRLPRVVERLSKGETVDVATEVPPLRFGEDEIGQVGQAFNAVQETAVQAAVQQAELRHGVRDVFLSLARRTQNLVHKQLRVVDGMERRQADADELEDLYRIDHMATRMRRNAENLIILSGATPGRTWRRPVPMVDVIRGAVAEVEGYQRVSLQPVQAGWLAGRVAGDVIHLLAELIENAASFSPPYTMVTVGGLQVARGFVVEIEDRGLGMSEEELAAVNRKLADPPDFNLADASRLGHYVVAKLAERHGVKVHLRSSPYGGITAIVLIPESLLGKVDQAEPAPAEVAAGDPAATPTPPAGGPPAALAPASIGSPETGPTTPAGLPWRVRQASLPRQLAGDQPPDPRPAPDEPAARDPEQVRQAMRAYQLGTQRGRDDTGAETADGDAAEPTRESPGE